MWLFVLIVQAGRTWSHVCVQDGFWGNCKWEEEELASKSEISLKLAAGWGRTSGEWVCHVKPVTGEILIGSYCLWCDWGTSNMAEPLSFRSWGFLGLARLSKSGKTAVKRRGRVSPNKMKLVFIYLVLCQLFCQKFEACNCFTFAAYMGRIL